MRMSPGQLKMPASTTRPNPDLSMLDIQLLRNQMPFVAESLATRGVHLDVSAFETLEEDRKAVADPYPGASSPAQCTVQTDRRTEEQGRGRFGSNDRSEWNRRGVEAQRAGLVGLARADQRFCCRAAEPAARERAGGADESANIEIMRWGTPREFDFEVSDHVDVGARLGLLDFETAAKISGALCDHARRPGETASRARPIHAGYPCT